MTSEGDTVLELVDLTKTVRWQGRRPGREPVGQARRGLRFPRTERGGQEHDHPDAPSPDPAEQGSGSVVGAAT